MLVELIGCTGAGKSSLARDLLRAGQELGVDVLTGDQFVLRQFWLDGIRVAWARAVCLNVLSLAASLLTWPRNIDLYLLTARMMTRLPSAVPWTERFSIARNVAKNVGMYEVARHFGSDQHVILMDEGTLHSAHYLFVHVSVEPDLNDLSVFVKSAPLPEVVVCVRQDEAVLVERTLARGHKRIPGSSHAQVQRFIRHATETFDTLVQRLMLEGRFEAVSGEHDLLVSPGHQDDPLLAAALALVRVGRDAAMEGPSATMTALLKLREVRTASDRRL